MKRSLLILNLLLIFFTSCKKDIQYPSNANDFLSFDFAPTFNPSLVTEDLSCSISDSLVTGTTTDPIDKSALVATFRTSGAGVTVNGVAQVSGVTKNDFTVPVVYKVTSKDGEVKDYVVKLSSFTGLPMIYLSTESPVVSKDDYVNGTMKIDGNLQYLDGLYNGAIQIKGRGNSTWFADKKPYKIKLASKTAILGMPANKEWALLANYFDKTLIRNDVAFELSERLGLTWTPRRRFVELFMNGKYDGNYLLTETVQTGSSRLNITPMAESSTTDTSGGFLVENDAQRDGDYWFNTPSGLPFVLKEPQEVTTPQYNYIKNYVSNIEDMLEHSKYSDPVFQEHIDADTFIDWFLVNELMRNRDAIMYSSVYFYKDKGGKFSMGPVWDFDLSSGGYAGSDPEGWYVKNAAWIGWPFDNDPAYRRKVKEKWNSIKSSKINTILAYIDDMKRALQYSQAENFKRWNIMNESTYDGSLITGSYDAELASLRSFLEKRIKWMDTEINAW